VYRSCSEHSPASSLVVDVDRRGKSVTTILDILADLRAAATDERDKGDRFERLMGAYLRTDPLYADRFTEVWMWADWPGREGKVDTGIDLVGTTMTPASSIHSFFRSLTGRSYRTASHPDAVPEAGLNLPRRIDGPASAARVARGLLRSRREEVTIALYLDDRHRFVGHAVVAVGWVQAAQPSARPMLQESQACQATGLVRLSPLGRAQRLGSRSGLLRCHCYCMRPSRARCRRSCRRGRQAVPTNRRSCRGVLVGFYLEVLRVVRRDCGRGVRFTPLDVVGVERSWAGTRVPSSRL